MAYLNILIIYCESVFEVRYSTTKFYVSQIIMLIMTGIATLIQMKNHPIIHEMYNNTMAYHSCKKKDTFLICNKIWYYIMPYFLCTK